MPSVVGKEFAKVVVPDGNLSTSPAFTGTMNTGRNLSKALSEKEKTRRFAGSARELGN
jgi:hypothetical protein